MGSKTSSSYDNFGEDCAGDEYTSSASDACPLSREAAKLLEISGSDTKAYEEWVEVVDAVEIVRSRPVCLEVRGSNCHTELAVSIVLYRRPCTKK
jgi:hypothetical protein